MDKTAIAGFGLGILILVAALFLGQVPLAALMSPEAILVVFGGTFTAMLISFSAGTLTGAMHAMMNCFRKDPLNTRTCVEYLTEIADFVRTDGILALQPLVGQIHIPFLRNGVQLLVDNKKAPFIRDTLGTDIEISYRESIDYARVFESAGGYAPTMGIIGAVIGLIHTVQFVADPVQLGKGVASAFSATLYGVALSNLFLLPLASKIRQRAKDEWFRKTLMLEGLISIAEGEHPSILEDKLQAFVGQVSSQQSGSGASASSASSSRSNPARAGYSESSGYGSKPQKPGQSRPQASTTAYDIDDSFDLIGV